MLLTEEFLFLDTPMKFRKHGKSHEMKESKAVERREDKNANYRAAEKKMEMIEKAMNGGKMPSRSNKNFRGR